MTGKVSYILQAFYGAIAPFIEIFAIAEEPYENLLNQLVQTVTITALSQANGTIYVANSASSNVSVIDGNININAVIATPQSICVNPLRL
ncbi:hypothetical protein [Bacillus cereus]|uniref:hypothetical protein n=1 Tax=Bacillus cereus TaxID=1396 RepID=UPI000BEE3A63|nr:hypothetical protein [Bacillus cereus]PEF60806.1 hypothetical protein CON35_28865 [Bacillus cereus]